MNSKNKSRFNKHDPLQVSTDYLALTSPEQEIQRRSMSFMPSCDIVSVSILDRLSDFYTLPHNLFNLRRPTNPHP